METKNPLKNIITDGGFTAIFRTIGCVGDSLSSGEHESLDENGVRGYHDFYEYSWGQFIARKCGSIVRNFSSGGLKASDMSDLFGAWRHVYDKENACQAYIIALGVNDASEILNGKLTVGDEGDVCVENYAENKATFAGYYAKVIQRLRLTSPESRIFLVTPPKMCTDEPERVKIYDKMAEILHKFAKLFPYTYVIDLRADGEVYDEKFISMYFVGGHLNAMGYLYTANVISTYIDFIIRENYEDFKQVAFINTGYSYIENQREV